MGRQRRPVTPRLWDQLRFGCRLYASTYDPPLPAQDADLVIWPEFRGLSPNSMSGARFCYEQGVKAAQEALPMLERWAVTPSPPRHVQEISMHRLAEEGSA
jgi:hypothetical protein